MSSAHTAVNSTAAVTATKTQAAALLWIGQFGERTVDHGSEIRKQRKVLSSVKLSGDISQFWSVALVLPYT